MARFCEQMLDSYVVVDLETTGLRPMTDMIIEIAAVKVINNKVADTFSTLVNPHIHINWEITQLTGINDDMVKNAPDVDIAIASFLSFVGDMALLGHNLIRFDLHFLNKHKQMNNLCADTFDIAQHTLSNTSGFSLSALCSHFNVINDTAHRALSDCLATHEVYQELKKYYCEHGAFFTMAVAAGRNNFQLNISEHCKIGTEVNIIIDEKKNALNVFAGEYQIGVVSGTKKNKYYDNADLIDKITISRLQKNAKDRFLLTVNCHLMFQKNNR